MKETHIPKVISIGNFCKALMTQVLIKEEMGGFTYSVQYTTDSKELLEKYFFEEDQKLQNEGRKLFDNKFGSFTTVMKIVKEFEK
jgi:hypothetical protein